jgi:hypothetical protein
LLLRTLGLLVVPMAKSNHMHTNKQYIAMTLYHPDILLTLLLKHWAKRIICFRLCFVFFLSKFCLVLLFVWDRSQSEKINTYYQPFFLHKYYQALNHYAHIHLHVGFTKHKVFVCPFQMQFSHSSRASLASYS